MARSSVERESGPSLKGGDEGGDTAMGSGATTVCPGVRRSSGSPVCDTAHVPVEGAP